MPDSDLYRRFLLTVERFPDEPALEVDGLALSYRDLDRRVRSAAAHMVRQHGRNPMRVGLAASRSVVAFAGYLAAMRIGATVVPLNVEHPLQRLEKICRLAQVDVLVVDEPHRARLDGLAATTVTLDDEAMLDGRESDLTPADADRVAYILFTSGSTGQPKGVPIRHRNVLAFVDHNIDRYEVGPGCRVSQLFDLSFDASVFELFVPWCAGAAVVVAGRKELVRPIDYIERAGLTHWFSVPSLVSVAAQLGNLRPVTSLRYSMFIGEQLTHWHAETWFKVAPGSVIENLYGPTELTVGCTHYRLPGDPGDWPNTSNNTLPIGQVYDFLDHLILDESGQVADEGELCVRGVQRFDGYLDPKDDDNRFTSQGYYRTGDRVRLESGELVHLGRLDAQLKVHGYRVEAGEIESAMRTVSGVTQAIVVVTAGKDADLVGYYCGDPVAERELRNRLRGLLPIYMVPRRFQHMEALPVNGNGKIDRAELATIAGG